MKSGFRYLIPVFTVLLFFCTKDKGGVIRGGYPSAVGDIIVNRCAVSGCHNSASYPAAGGLNLSTWNAMFQGSSSGSPVVPFSSKFSSLCYFINTYPGLGIQNQPTMPLYSTSLSFDQVRTIKNWIEDGARNSNGESYWTGDGSRKKLYAVNQGCDVVTVFDSQTKLPIRFIEVGNKPGNEAPHQVKVSPDGKFWYVTFINNNILQKFRCSDDSYVGEIPLTPKAAGTGEEDAIYWNTFVISSDSKSAYCVSWTFDGKVASVDLENMKLKKFIGGQYYPHGVALNGNDDKIYVTSQTGNYITEIDTGFTTANEIVLENAPLSKLSSLDPHEIILSANKKHLVITCQKSNDVRFLSLDTKSVTSVVSTGPYPQEIVYSPEMNQYFVTCTSDTISFPGSHGSIARIDASGNVSRIKCGYQPHGIAVDESTNIIYVLSRNILASGPPPHHSSQCQGRNGYVSFIDLKSFKLLPERYELSVDPYFISVRP